MLARVVRRQGLDRLIQVEEAASIIIDAEHVGLDGDSERRTSMLEPPLVTRSIDDEVPHGARRGHEELAWFGPFLTALGCEFQVDLVNERRRLHRLAGLQATHVPLCEGAELVVEQGK